MADDLTIRHPDCFSFGSWCWLRHERVLLRSGSRVRLGSRARDILALLLEEPGALVTNARIIAHVWPGTVVVKTAVRVHIAHLRKFLRDSLTCYIQNVHGVGYRFTAPSPQRLTSCNSLSLTEGTDVIGRASIIDTLRNSIMQSRLVTLTGPGGIGKSAVAIAAAMGLRTSGGVELIVVDMLKAKDVAAFKRAVAAALKMRAPMEGPQPGNGVGVPQHPGPRECLLVADNCDRGFPAAAVYFEDALQKAPRLRILATCRRPVGARDERVLRLEPLELPPRNTHPSVAEVTGETRLQFGPFRWLPDRRTLLKSGKPVPMSPRVAAILAILLERPGALVLKKEIQRRAWPVNAVRDSTLRACIVALRKVLQAGLPGADCVQNVMGHGYRLVLPATSAVETSSDAARTTANLPAIPATGHRVGGGPRGHSGGARFKARFA